MPSALIVSWLSAVLALAALAVSIANLWISQIRRGRLQLSTPTIFYFGWDDKEILAPKIMFRSVLFATSKRGIIIENVYLRVFSKSAQSIFSFWGYDAGSGMVRGSGVRVGEEGFLAYHHFNPPADEQDFAYERGLYEVEVWVRRADRSKDEKLGAYVFDLPEILVSELCVTGKGLLWDWLPQQRKYVPVAAPKSNRGR